MTALEPIRTAETDSWRWKNLRELPAKPPVHPNLGLIGDIGLVYPGKRHVFSGPQESAKTLAAYLIGLAVGRQGHLWALIDFEMGAYDARDRLTDLGATDNDLDNILYYEPDQEATPNRLQGILCQGIDLVVIDAAAGAYDLQGLDDNKRQDVEKLTRLYVRTFWQAGVATIFLDHVVKNTETRGAYAIGSERKVGGADVHLGFSVVTPISRGHTGLYKITTHKDRGGYLKRGLLAEMELRSDPETHAITCELRATQETPEGERWMPTKVMQHISELLEQQNDTISRSQLAALAGGNKQYAIQAIDELVLQGYVTETAGPRNAKLLTHQKAFTVLEWETEQQNRPVPTRSPPVPERDTDDPFRVPLRGLGRNGSEPLENTPPVPDWTWVDELTPKDHPPGDLHDDPHPF